MAPNQQAVEAQTIDIIKHLLEDEFVDECGRCPFSQVETDSPAGSDGKFVFRRYLQAALAAVFVFIFSF